MVLPAWAGVHTVFHSCRVNVCGVGPASGPKSLSRGGAAMANTVEGEGRPGSARPWPPRLAAPRPTNAPPASGPAGCRCASHRGRRSAHPDAEQVLNEPQGVAVPAPPHLRAEHDQFLGSAGSQLRVGRPFARLRVAKRGSVHVRRARLCQPPCASEAPRGLHHSKGQGLGEWRRRPAGPVGADRRRQPGAGAPARRLGWWSGAAAGAKRGARHVVSSPGASSAAVRMWRERGNLPSQIFRKCPPVCTLPLPLCHVIPSPRGSCRACEHASARFPPLHTFLVRPR